MNKVLFSLLGYSGSIVGAIATSTVANPDTKQTLPYPEVMNLNKVPRFDARGIVRSTDITSQDLPDRLTKKTVVTKAKPVKITKETIAKAISKPTLETAKPNRVGERVFAPTSMMVLGYSMPGGKTSLAPKPIVY